MKSHSVGTLYEPVFGRRMPSYSENMAPTRLSQPQCPPSFMGKQYDGAYFSYKAQGKDITAFPAPWSNTESSVVARRSPVTHLTGIDRLHIYRKDSSSEESHPTHKNSPTKQGFTLYTKSPTLSSPSSTASVIVRNDQAAGDRIPSDRPVYLTVPQAVYRHSPCCSDLCCVMGHGPPSLSNQLYDHSWKSGESGEVLLKQRRLHTEGVSLCSPGQTRAVPAVLDQTYSPTKVKEVSHSLQCSPRAYPGPFPSQSPYEPVIYHNRSPISKYGQAPQHPAYYYSPANVEVENRIESNNTGSKHSQEIPVLLKHPLHPPGDHYMATASLPRIEAMPNPAFFPGFDYSGYLVPRLNLNTSPIHTHLKHPHAVHSDYIHTSPKHVHRPIPTLPSVHRDKSTQHTEHSSPFAHIEQTSPTACSKKSTVPKSSAQSQSRYCPPKHNVHVGLPSARTSGPHHPAVAPGHLGLPSRHHALHFPSYLRHPHISPTRVLSNKTNKQKILYCPPIPVLMENRPSPQSSYIHKGPLKRSISSSSPIKVPDEDDDVYEVDTDHKRQRTEHGSGDGKDKESSPPMPVINNVFSLAPYQTYIQLARLRLGALQQRSLLYSSEQVQAQLPNEDARQQTAVLKDTVTDCEPVREVRTTYHKQHHDQCTEPSKDITQDPPRVNLAMKQEKQESVSQRCIEPTTPPAEVKVKLERMDEPTNACTAVSKAARLDPPKERPNQEDAENNISKREEDDTMDQSSCSELSDYPEQLKIIKKEPEEVDVPDDGHVFKIKKDKTDFEDSRSGSGRGQKVFQREGSPPPALSTPPHPDGKVNFLNIPPQCLKLSTYNIMLPETNLLRTVQTSANKSPTLPPSTQPATPSIPLQMPVRKHFFELHQSLVKLISKSVGATSEETLKSWLSKMELNHLLSGKSQKVSCLFGAKGREACLNEEMKSSLNQVVQRLREYTAQEHCPFPFVMRTGAIFLPMLVVKEVLFPSVHGALIDQVLQVHKVELRPTTLSEEKTLIQMHKRPCSSRLRRLMSLKHLPDVYADVVNLLYFSCVCKQLESPSCEVQSRVQE